MLFKNVASQKALVFAYNITTGAAVTGDAANITAKISKDGAAFSATNDVNPTELEGGIYVFDLTQAETNCDLFALLAVSATSNVKLEPVLAYTTGGAIPQAGVASAADLATLDDYVDTEVAAIKAKTDNLPASPAATSDIPLASAIADAVWDEAMAGHASAGTAGKYLADILDDTGASGVLIHITSLAGLVDMVWNETLADHLTAGSTGAALNGVSAPTAAAVADAVWDEAIAGHLTGGSCGAALNSAGSAGDPWGTNVPGAYVAGTAGYILGNRLNDTITSRASQSTLDTLDNYVDTEVAAIKAKTDNLPASPAAVSDIPSAATIATTVWAAGTRTLSSFGSLITDIWAAATRSLTDKAGFSISGTKTTLDTLNDISTANVRTQVDAALDASDAELSAVPGATTSMRSRIKFIFQYFKFKRTSTSSVETLYKDNDSTPLGTANISDDTVTFTKGKVS